MYCPQGRHNLINTENALWVLAFACFLELQELADFCSDIILTRMNAANIHSMILSVDRLASRNLPDGDAPSYNTLLASHHDSLEKCCLSYLLQLTCAIGFESTIKYADTEPKSYVPGSQWKSAEILLASLSTTWIKKVLAYHTICIESEFARYSTIKRIFEYKEGGIPVKDEEKTDNENLIEPAKSTQACENSDNNTYITNIMESVMPSQKKRKRSYSICDNNDCGQDGSRMMILKSSINYVHMSFEDLSICRNDQLIPDETILKSFWKQSELINGVGYPGAQIQEFRFSARFLDTGNLLNDNKPEKTFSSDPISCAGAQYRVILCRSDNQSTPENLEDCIVIENDKIPQSSRTGKSKMIIKALLQRTRSASNNLHKDKYNISYKLYCFDRNAFIKGKIQDAAFFEPVTVCNFDGSGIAKPLPTSMIQPDESLKKKGKDLNCDFLVSVLIHFDFKA